MKRTTVFADEDDLAILKAAAASRGITEAALIRDAIHLAAMANQTWTEPFFTDTYDPDPDSGSPPPHRDGDPLEDTWTEKAEAYERTQNPPR